MPPTSSVRASIAATDTNSNTGRRHSNRQSRSSRIDYSTRHYGGRQQQQQQQDHVDPDPPGFFPSITYFADAIAALPREVQAHITRTKEVEAKIYGPTEALKQLSTNIMAMPVPPPHNQQSSPRLLTFTAPTSATNSMAGSVINGSQPGEQNRALDTLEAQQDEQADQARRSDFSNLRHVIGNMIANLDEKNVVMAEANRALAHQIARLDSVIPHIEAEISEESRLGSLTHWAYAENRSKKQTVSTQQERNRRDVAATSSLAAAAAAVHEGDIAAARGEARRETKKTQRAHALDSDFDDRPAKRTQTAKARKGPDTDPKPATGLGIANGTSAPPAAATTTTKRRKVEKGPAVGGAPAMERSASNMSAVGKAGRAANTTPRSTPAAEPAKKKTKPGPLPGATKKRNAALSQTMNSPKIASSPILGMAHLQQEAPTARPSSSRARQNSASNLQYSLLPEKEPSRPASVSNHGSVNGNTTMTHAVDSGIPDAPPVATTEARNGAAEEEKEEEDEINAADKPTKTTETSKPPSLKNEDVAMDDGSLDIPPTRGRTSKISTPRTDNFPDSMTRTRRRHGSPRGSNTPTDSLSREYHKRRGRRKSGSGAHILKQIASFNRSPDAGRRRDESRDSAEMSEVEESGRRSQPPRVTTVSRGRKANGSRATTSSRRTEPTPEAEEEAVEVAEEEEVEEPEDPNEPKYCYCGQGSFGEMIACDNDDCPMEWFHLGCTGLRAVPGDNVKWYCDVCKEAMQQPQKGKKGKPGNNRH